MLNDRFGHRRKYITTEGTLCNLLHFGHKSGTVAGYRGWGPCCCGPRAWFPLIGGFAVGFFSVNFIFSVRRLSSPPRALPRSFIWGNDKIHAVRQEKWLALGCCAFSVASLCSLLPPPPPTSCRRPGVRRRTLSLLCFGGEGEALGQADPSSSPS